MKKHVICATQGERTPGQEVPLCRLEALHDGQHVPTLRGAA